MRARNTASKRKSPSSSRSASRSPRSSASSSSYVSSSTNGRSELKVCSRSHGQPAGPRSVRMMSTSRSKRSPAESAMWAYGTIGNKEQRTKDEERNGEQPTKNSNKNGNEEP